MLVGEILPTYITTKAKSVKKIPLVKYITAGLLFEFAIKPVDSLPLAVVPQIRAVEGPSRLVDRQIYCLA